MVNGIGTIYYGKKNVTARVAPCTGCGKVANLESYDARYWFVIFLIPIVPLGHRRVVDYCPLCTRHFAVKREDWERQQREAGAAAMAWTRDGGTREAAEQALVAVFRTQDTQALEELSVDVLKKLPKEEQTVQLVLELARQQYRGTLVEHALRHGMEHFPLNEGYKLDLIYHLAINQRPDEAKALAQPIIAAGDASKLGHLRAIAESYQGIGRHEQALEMFDVMAQISPKVEMEKDFRELRALSQKNQRTGKAIAKDWRNLTAPAPAKPNVARNAAIVAGVLGGAALLYGGLDFAASKSRTVFLANGLSTAYSVTIDGREHTLEPGEFAEVTIAEGTHRVEPGAGAPPAVESFTFELKSAVLTRMFQDGTFVLNPDRCGVVLTSTVHVTGGSGKPTWHYATHVNRPYHPFPHAKYGLSGEEMPTSVRLKRSESRRMTSVGFVAAEEVSVSRLEVPDVERQALAARLLNLTAEDPDVLQSFFFGATAEQIEKFARPLLARRPVLVELHRHYQNWADRATPPVDIETEYAALAAELPNNATHAYLYARAIMDGSRRQAKMRDAMAMMEEPVANAYSAVGSVSLRRGEFAEALEIARQMQERWPDAEYGYSLEIDALVALGRWDEVLEAAEDDANPMRANAASDAQLVALLKTGATAEVSAQRMALSQALRQADSDEDRESIRSIALHLDAIEAMSTGTLELLAAKFPKGHNPALEPMRSLLECNEQTAPIAIAQSSKNAPTSGMYRDSFDRRMRMLETLTALYVGNAEWFANAKERLCLSFEARGSSYRTRVVPLLRGGDPERLATLPEESPDSPIDIAALYLIGAEGMAPAARAEFHAKAAQLAFDRTDVQMFALVHGIVAKKP